jgi:hypothetical protein
MRRHVLKVAKDKKIKVTWCSRAHYSRAWWGDGPLVIRIPRIRSTISYVCALHELGHHLGDHQHSRSVITRERHAWRWAKANALVWTQAMWNHGARCFRTYLSRYGK